MTKYREYLSFIIKNNSVSNGGGLKVGTQIKDGGIDVPPLDESIRKFCDCNVGNNYSEESPICTYLDM